MKKKMFKKIYVEVTNVCNLSCPFCLKSKRKKENMSFDNFKHVLNEIKDYTDYLYLHVLGEPLMHPSINEFIDYAGNLFNINITTNGYLINKLTSKNIRQINISLHSFSKINKKSFEDYLSDIFEFVDNVKENTYISYRLWSHSKDYEQFIKALEDKYQVNININKGNFKLEENVFLSFEDEFIWPDNNNDNNSYDGVCYGLKDHIAILSNGVVVPCCLDGNGTINLGNIFTEKFDSIINSSKLNTLKKELSNGIRNSDLCKKCNFSTKRYK